MGHKIYERPLKRTKLRLYLGKRYFTLLRYAQWYLGDVKYAGQLVGGRLAYAAFSHKTPLIRKLRKVDMGLQYNKVKNLAIAAERLNGLIIKPGETFSYWRLIGRPSYRRGFVDGLVLKTGGTFGAGAGGGLCQLSNLIYWMALHTPLTVTERYRHSYDVFPDVNRTQPFGSGATCVYNYRDLQLYNGTGADYQLLVGPTGDYLAGEWRTGAPQDYRYEVYEKEHAITSTYWGGYVRSNSIWRRAYDREGFLAADEFISENHALMMYQPLLDRGESRDKARIKANDEGQKP